MASLKVLTWTDGSTTGIENVSRETFSVFAFVSVPTFAPNILRDIQEIVN